MMKPSPYRRLALCAGLAAALPIPGAAAGPMVPASSAAPHAAPAPLPAAPAQIAAPAPQAALAAPAPTAGPLTAIAVSAWGFSQTLPHGSVPPPQAASAGRPLYVWMTLDGGQAAIDRLQNGGRLAVEVHWTSESPDPHAPNLTSNLDVGRPDVAARLQAEVARTGRFEWHSWTRKDSLSPGRWTVSLTDQSGQPIQCGEASGPCQLSIDVS